MKRMYAYMAVLLMLSITCFSAENMSNDPDLKHKAQELISRPGPFRFQENKGQIADQNGRAVPDVLFSAIMGNQYCFDVYV